MPVIRGQITLGKVKNGEDGVPGPPGSTTYTWVKYADTPTSGISNDPSGKNYIGLAYNKTSPVESEVYSDYSWSLIKGDKGSQGIPGTPGDDGKTYYTWVMYADDEFGNNMQNDPEGKAYIGIAYNKETEVESNDPSQYSWALFKGKDAYVYQAYAWNADGTDRFTIDYPNENELANSRSPKIASHLGSIIDIVENTIVEEWNANDAVKHTISGGTSATVSGVLRTNTTVTADVKYVHSIYVKNIGSTTVRISNNLSQAIDVLPGEVKRVVFDARGSSTGTPSKQFVINRLNISDVQEFIIWHAKIEASDNTATIWTPQPSEDFFGAFPSYSGTYSTFDDVQSTDPSEYTWQRILGQSGENGKDGIAGKDGVGVSDTNITYAQSTSGTTPPSTGWTAQVPTLVKGQYLWTKTVWTYTDASTETGYTVSYNAKDGNDGNDGIAGKDGVGISSTKVEYVGSSSGTVKPTTGWSTTIPTVAEGNFLWTRTTWAYTDNTSEVGYSVAKMGAKGDQGIQGPQGPNGQTYYTWLKYADTPTSGMSDSPTGKTYMGLAYNKTSATESTNYSDYSWSLIKGADGVQGPQGPDGQTTYTWIKYGTSSAGAGISDDPTGKTYIGIAYNKTTATESTNPADYSWSLIKGDKGDTGPQGPTGNGISSSTITYAASTSGTTAPTTGWVTTPPTVAANSFLWTRVIINYTDGTNSTSYSVGKMGAQGPQGTTGAQGPQGPTGNGVSDSVVNYASSTSGTTAPTSGWVTTPPTVAANQYLWTRVVISYTDGTSSTAYSIGKMGAQGPQGVKGDTGPQGPTGPTGNGISSSTIDYAASTSGTTAPTTGWQATPPTVAANSFLWTRVVINYTDSTSSTSYSVGKMGAQGPQGATGATGAQGPTGPTGPTGNGVSSSVVNYAASTSGTTAPTSGWTTSPPTVAANSFLWTRVVITYTDGTSTTAYSVGKMGAQGPQGATGAQGPTGPTGPQGPQGIQGVAYLQPTQPSTTQNGAQWFKTVSTTDRTVTEIYTYVTGSGWIKTPLASGSLAINTLSAITANLGNITAGTIDGVEIRGEGLYSEYDYQIVTGGTSWRKGKLSMAGGYFRNDFQTYVKSTGAVQNNGFSQFSHEAIQFVVFEGTQTTTPDRTLSITPYSFTMTDDRGRGGSLTFQDLYSLGKTGIPAASGWRQYNTSSSSSNFPSATRVGRVVQLAGAFAPNAAKASGTENEVMGTLPVGFRPDSDCNFICQGTGANMYLLVVKANGQLTFNRYRGDTGSSNNYKFDYKDCTEGAWINIACAYAAADV